ncbi:sulfotransferase [Oceanibaculum sp.]|uniref:sulfotransferase n=1 Tax=Oceanibaculum sp. TaxID=1903597 RepID=UPI0025877BA3|nr:sulfotransferase [Oceanibaculum sp.]MCH2394334.1 sulfotransferase [Oceanibaculum sp.]
MKLRLIHQLARSGGTLINRLLLAQGVAVLSEVHPLGWANLDPLAQACDWFGLIGEGDLQGRDGLPYAEVIALIADKARRKKQKLAIRDWSHLDFMPIGMGLKSSLVSVQAAVLADRFDLIRIATVRHPLDQWLSLAAMLAAEGRPPRQAELEHWLDGMVAFAVMAAATGFVRYEDIAADPAAGMAELCRRLALPFDPARLEGWRETTQFSTGGVPGRAASSATIERLEPRPAPPHLLHRLNRDRRYRQALELLGYEVRA